MGDIIVNNICNLKIRRKRIKITKFWLWKGMKICQPLWGPLMKFGGKVRKIFGTQNSGPGWISYNFVLLMNKFFASAWISQLPTVNCSVLIDCKELLPAKNSNLKLHQTPKSRLFLFARVNWPLHAHDSLNDGSLFWLEKV